MTWWAWVMRLVGAAPDIVRSARQVHEELKGPDSGAPVPLTYADNQHIQDQIRSAARPQESKHGTDPED